MQVSDPNKSVVGRRFENVQNFLRFVTSNLGMPSDCQFSCADLESEGWEDRPRVADCVLWLKRLHEGVCQPPLYSPLTMLHGSNDLLNSLDSPGKAMMMAERAARHKMQMPQAPSFGSPIPSPGSTRNSGTFPNNGSFNLAPGLGMNLQGMMQGGMGGGLGSPFGQSLASAQQKQMQACTGVTHLMQQCTVMLKEKMYVSSSTQLAHHSSNMSQQHMAAMQHQHHQQRFSSGGGNSEFNMEAVGPVLESVLANLTQEYERRLLLKDQEINTTKVRQSSHYLQS